ncbi:MAG: hypothetical protein ACM3NV_06700, partial [Syntrophothermus sp.]
MSRLRKCFERAPSWAGRRLPERMRTVVFAVLGITVALALGLVALFSQSGWPLRSLGPLSEPSQGVDAGVALGAPPLVAQAASLGELGPTPARGEAVSVPAPPTGSRAADGVGPASAAVPAPGGGAATPPGVGSPPGQGETPPAAPSPETAAPPVESAPPATPSPPSTTPAPVTSGVPGSTGSEKDQGSGSEKEKEKDQGSGSEKEKDQGSGS